MRYGIGHWVVAIGAFAGLMWGAENAHAQFGIRTRVIVRGPVLPLPPPPPFVPGPVVVAPAYVPVPAVPYVYGPIPYPPGNISIRAPYTAIDITPGRVQVNTPGYVGDIATPEFRFQPDDSIEVPSDAVEGQPSDGVAPTSPATPESSDIAPPADSTSILRNRGRSVVTRKQAAPKTIRLTNTSKTQSVSFKVNTFPFTIKPGESTYFSADSQWKVAMDSFQKNPSEPTLALERGDYEFSNAAGLGWKLVRVASEEPVSAPADTESLPPPIVPPTRPGEPTLADPPPATEPTSAVSKGSREF